MSMTTATARSNVVEIIDGAPISRYQWRIFAMLFLVVMLDGYDTQCIAFAAPAIAKAWALKPGAFGAIFSAGLLGSVLGSVIIGPLSDRFGRKRLILASFAIFTALTGACGFATGFNELLVYRFLAGIGLGGALINCLPLASEFAPKRVRTLAVSSCLWGFPLGAVFGGLIAGDLMVAYGWQAVFYVGTLLPLVLLPFLAFLLPESITYLTLLGRRAEIAGMLRRIDPRGNHLDNVSYALPESIRERGSVKELFGRDIAVGTSLLWLIAFLSLVLVYCLINWIPTVLNQAGLPLKVAVMGTAMLNFAGILGNIVIARLVGGRNPVRAISMAYLCGAVAVAGIGYAAGGTAPVMTMIFLAGFFIIGGQITFTAFATNFYPTAIRSTGLGFVQAVGRVGSMVGPLAGGAVLAVSGAPTSMFLFSSIPAFAAFLALSVLATRQGVKS